MYQELGGKERCTQVPPKEELRMKYRIEAKGFKVIVEELKQRISAKSEKLRGYARGNQYKQNKLF